MNFATQYNARNRAYDFATYNTDPTMTQQSDKDLTNINVIIAKYMKGQPLPQVTEPAKFGDFTGISSFTEAMEMITKAKESFAEVPAKIRQRFNNDPQRFMDFIHDPANTEELVKMGLAKEPPITDTPPTALTPQGDQNGSITTTAGHRTEQSGPSQQGSPRLPEGSSHNGLRTGRPGSDQARGPGDGQRGDSSPR